MSDNNLITATDIAKLLDVSNAAITRAIKKGYKFDLTLLYSCLNSDFLKTVPSFVPTRWEQSRSQINHS